MHRILIVEDDESTRSLMSSFLMTAGYEVAAVEDGKKGIIKLRTYRADILLLDLMMPEMDGFALLKELKSEEFLDFIKADFGLSNMIKLATHHPKLAVRQLFNLVKGKK